MGKRHARRVLSPWVVAAALAVVLVASACVPPPPPPSPSPCPGCTVYLTFDDGPSVYTPQILSALEAKGVPATFFVLGERAVQFPSYVQREHADGDGIGDHTWDHPDLTTLPPEQVRSELQSTADEIASLTGAPPTLWRPPFGAFNDTVTQIASSLGLSMRLWDVNPSDFTMPGTDVIVSRVVDNVSNGSIVLLHDGSQETDFDRSQTVAALPTIIDTLRAAGYSFGSLSTVAGTATPNAPTGPTVPIGPE
jgi:peptidoglycan-N-acetylglucosamine deacetylase